MHDHYLLQGISKCCISPTQTIFFNCIFFVLCPHPSTSTNLHLYHSYATFLCYLHTHTHTHLSTGCCCCQRLFNAWIVACGLQEKTAKLQKKKQKKGNREKGVEAREMRQKKMRKQIWTTKLKAREICVHYENKMKWNAMKWNTRFERGRAKQAAKVRKGSRICVQDNCMR